MYRITEETIFQNETINIEFIIPRHHYIIPIRGEFNYNSINQFVKYYLDRIISNPSKYKQYEIISKRPAKGEYNNWIIMKIIR